jgi:CubicO group peptidase (beta-lactamase class C family)
MDCPGPTLLIAALCAAIGFAAPCAKAAEAPLADAQIREMGRQWLIDNDGIGLSIGIYDDGERWFYNFGTTQLDGSRLPGKDTVYEIGAISRTFAGQLLARAVVEGRAALTDEAARHLDHPYPNLENGGEKVRLQHLVSSTSHLIDNIPDLTQVRAVPQEPLPVTHQRVVEQYTRAEFLRQLTRVMPRQPPGGPPANSNVGAMVLGVALEKIYGDSFENILAREIEKPLRMASGVAPPAKLLARGYTASNEPLPPFAARTQYASLGLRYSVEDLLKFAAWQMVERDASVKLAHRPTWSTPDGRAGVAFFWIVGDSPQGRRLQHTGSTFGFASFCDLYPEAKVAVVVLSNKAADGAQDSLRALSAKIIGMLRPDASGSQGVRPPLSSADAPQPAR